MILVVAPTGELRDALVAALPPDTVCAEPGDPAALVRAMRGVDRMFLACDDPVAAGDVVAAAEMAHVYYCVSLRPVAGLEGSALRSRVLFGEADEVPPTTDAAALAAQALRDDPPPP